VEGRRVAETAASRVTLYPHLRERRLVAGIVVREIVDPLHFYRSVGILQA
jgi:hypothetical protein